VLAEVGDLPQAGFLEDRASVREKGIPAPSPEPLDLAKGETTGLQGVHVPDFSLPAEGFIQLLEVYERSFVFSVHRFSFSL